MPKCKFCDKVLTQMVADLGAMPPANAYAQAGAVETIFPLHAYICESCFLVQVQEFEAPENIFSDYAYFSSVSKDWLVHCEKYCEKMMRERNFTSDSFIVEIASNDGYLLKNFVEKSIKVLGIEPAKNVAAVAIEKGIPTISEFFGVDSSEQIVKNHGKADLITANNVFAHAPLINDFTKGLSLLLDDNGILTLEFPHLMNLIKELQFDTIYHEHFFYFSLTVVERVLKKHGLRVFDVENLETHGGSLRVYACHENNESQTTTENVRLVKEKEQTEGLNSLETYLNFNKRVQRVKWDTLRYLINEKTVGKRIVAFGAAAKGSTFLNYCGIGQDFVDYIVDETPYKQGLYMPGSQIPIHPFEKLLYDKPDIVVIIPWNWTEEILRKIDFIYEYGGKAVTFIPSVKEHLLQSDSNV